MYRKYLTISAFIIIALLFTFSCDSINQSADLVETDIPFKILSVEKLNADNDYSQQLFSYLDKKNSTLSSENVVRDNLKLVKMSLPTSDKPEEVFHIVTAQIEVPNDQINNFNTPSAFESDISIISYIVEFDHALLEKRSFSERNEHDGISMIIDLHSNKYELYHVSNRIPVKRIKSDNFNSNEMNIPLMANSDSDTGCLDCGIAECYDTVKEACDGDSDCRFLCDMLDLAGGWCSGQIAVACTIYNTYVFFFD